MSAGLALELDDDEQAMLAGETGPARQLAMQVVLAMGRAVDAARLVKITSAHIDSCLYHGQAGLDFAERLVAGGGRVSVPTTLNVASLDLLHPELVRLEPATSAAARRLMDAYLELGCQPSWTCAPYQLPERPTAGSHVAWAESNAIVFANSVLGARTARYGDFMDICAALTGRVPLAGLHLSENRHARVVLHIRGLSAEAFGLGELYALIGHVLGQEAGSEVAAISGLPRATSEDQLKALGAASASSGAVALVHVVGVTPEATTLEECLGGRAPGREVEVGPARLRRAWTELSTADEGTPLAAISLGTPHFSLAELERLAPLLAVTDIHESLTMYVSTGRHVLSRAEERGLLDAFRRERVQLVVDTCTYITPILDLGPGAAVMTNSAKWAWYAPGNLGIKVAFGTLEDCLVSAAAGRVRRAVPEWLNG